MAGGGAAGGLGRTVVTLARPGWALAVDAANYGGSAFFLSRLRLPAHVALEPQSFLADLRDGPTALLALRVPAVVVAAGAFMAGLGNLVFNALWETALQKHVAPAALSRVSAYDWFGSLAFQPVGHAVAGPAAAAVGTSATLWIAAAGSLVVAATCLATPSARQLTA